MKVIIYRDKETKRIVRDAGDDYELLKARGKTDEDIAALVEEFNSRENCPQTVEIVELDEVAEYYRTRKLNAYKEQLNDFAFMEDRELEEYKEWVSPTMLRRMKSEEKNRENESVGQKRFNRCMYCEHVRRATDCQGYAYLLCSKLHKKWTAEISDEECYWNVEKELQEEKKND